jgi:alkylation response protein AidB-like acyl-CoA dehydrogenase
MNLAFTEEQEQLRRDARRLVAKASPMVRVRAVMATDAGHDRELWTRMAAELGWAALAIPERYGGVGCGAIEQIAIFEVLGAGLVPSPLFATACLAAPALLMGGSEEQRRRYLPGLGDGSTRATLAYGVGCVVARRDGAGYRLAGERSLVVDGHTAELVIALADAPDGPAVFAMAGASLVRQRCAPLDATRPLARLRFDDVYVAERDRLSAEGAGALLIERCLERARIALAAEQLGGAQACLDMAVGYTKLRHQFGRPIGSFQAIKHKCADMLVRVESARSAVYGAACVAADADAPSDELTLASATAAASASEAYFACAAENIQIHGGIGFTWEHDAHLHFKRASASRVLLGAPDRHRDTVARHLGLELAR